MSALPRVGRLSFASVFAGIGGFDLAFEREGWATTSQIEINPQRQKVLAAHFPTARRFGDVQEVHGRDLGVVDVVCGGFPCKGVSVAGAGAGLAHPETGRFFDFVRLLDEYQRLVDQCGATWVAIENTPGLLGSNGGADMATVVRSLERLGYGLAWRVVDSRAVGSAQRRQRLYIVGHRSGDPRAAWRVLADPERGGWSPDHADPRARARAQRSALVGPAGGDRADGALIWRKSRNGRSEQDYSTWVPATYANVLTASEGGTGPVVRQRHLVAQGGRLRVLVPEEWEQLQGFPPGWTEAMDTDAERFAACGDAMNVHPARWLARRLGHVDALLKAA